MRKILPHPPVMVQPTRATCWAATLASLLQVSNQKKKWYGGGDGSVFGTVVPPTVMDIVEFVRKYDTGPTGVLSQGNWALKDREAWKIVTEGFFALRDTKSYDGGSGRLNKLFFTKNIRDDVNHQRYGILMFTDPGWGAMDDGRTPWHGKVVYGYDDDSATGEFFFFGMDPDPAADSAYGEDNI